MLVEASISIALILVAIVIVFNLSRRLLVTYEEKNAKFRINESMYAVCTEIQSNVKYEDLKTNLDEGTIKLTYNKEFIDNLVSKDLLSFERTNGSDDFISIKLLSEEKEKLNLEVNIVSKGFSLTKDISKGLWMDYV